MFRASLLLALATQAAHAGGILIDSRDLADSTLSYDALLDELSDEEVGFVYGDLYWSIQAQKPDVVVVFQPSRLMSDADVTTLHKYAYYGGRVVVVTDGETGVEPLLERVGVSLGSIETSPKHYLYSSYPFANSSHGHQVVATLANEVHGSGSSILRTWEDDVLGRSVSVGGSWFGGEIAVLPSSWIVRDAPTWGYVHGLYLYDNCDFVLDLLDAGACSKDVRAPTVSVPELWMDGKRVTETYPTLEGINGKPLWVEADISDDRGVFKVTLSVDGEEQVLRDHAENPGSWQHGPRLDVLEGAEFAWGDLHHGWNRVKICAEDQAGNRSCAGRWIRRVQPLGDSSDLLYLRGDVKDGLAMTASNLRAGAAIFDAKTYDNDGACVYDPDLGPYLTVASAEHGSDLEDPVGAAEGRTIAAGLDHLRDALDFTGGLPFNLTVHLDPVHLDPEGAGWWVDEEDVEHRLYAPLDEDDPNYRTPYLELRYRGEPMLRAEVGTLHVGIDYGDPEDCDDDGISAVVQDLSFELHPSVDGAALVVGKAILEDLAGQPAWVMTANGQPANTADGLYPVDFGSFGTGWYAP